MSKLFVFGIGGSGSRVLRSLTMLLAAGVDCGVDTIVPIIIDRDVSNHDLTRTKLLLEDYIKVNKISNTNGENRFFKTKIEPLKGGLLLRLRDNKQRFADFIGRDTMSPENKALVDVLFSKDTLNLDMTEGFQGNPNIGSVVLNQFEDNDVFMDFANTFANGDKIFIISSIFGGTGASGFPLLRKTLHTLNVKDSNGHILPNWGLINKAPIGAISVLPYFAVENPNDESQVDSDTFTDKAKAALTYYQTEDRHTDTFYYIADKLITTYEHHKGGDSQKNDAHFVELAAAMSIIDFVYPGQAQKNINRDAQNNIVQTKYKEFGIMNDGSSLDFTHLADNTKKLLVNPLSRFLLFSKYLGYSVKREIKDGKEILVAKKTAENNWFKKEHKYQPYAFKINEKGFLPKLRFTEEFRKNDSIQKLESIQKQFIEWLLEMENQKRKFSPFNLESSSANDFVRGNLSLSSTKDFGYKDWAKVDNQLNTQIKNVDKALEDEKCFIELFYLTTQQLIN